MAHELSDAISNERIEAAVGHALRLHARQPGVPLELLARTAVDETFCMCVTSMADAVERHLSAMHAALVADVLRRAGKRLLDRSQANIAEQTAV